MKPLQNLYLGRATAVARPWALGGAFVLGMACAVGQTTDAPQGPAAAPVQASDHRAIDDSYGDAFVGYKPYVIPGKKPDEVPKPAAPPPPASPTEPQKPGASKVDVAWLRKNFDLLRDRAIDDPSDDNISAFYYVQHILLDKAQRYEEAAHRVVMADPMLNENSRVPLASAGAKAVLSADVLAEGEAARELGKQGGLLIFVDGNCRFCAEQMPIMGLVKREYGIEYLVISIDGTSPASYKGSVLKDNGLFSKLGLKLTPSVVYVPKPRGYAGRADPNQYLVVSQGFYVEMDLIKQIAFAGHSTKLLSAKTMADLDVWDQGVSSQEDLATLALDPNDPTQIKQVVQSMLLKQYAHPTDPSGNSAGDHP
jgi:conjugal transfer pilus assembly protein TraF